MLCLSRRAGQVVHVGDDVTITVLKVDRGKVVLGFDAPRAVVIDRPEVRAARLARAKAEKREG